MNKTFIHGDVRRLSETAVDGGLQVGDTAGRQGQVDSEAVDRD